MLPPPPKSLKSIPFSFFLISTTLFGAQGSHTITWLVDFFARKTQGVIPSLTAWRETILSALCSLFMWTDLLSRVLHSLGNAGLSRYLHICTRCVCVGVCTYNTGLLPLHRGTDHPQSPVVHWQLHASLQTPLPTWTSQWGRRRALSRGNSGLLLESEDKGIARFRGFTHRSSKKTKLKVMKMAFSPRQHVLLSENTVGSHLWWWGGSKNVISLL